MSANTHTDCFCSAFEFGTFDPDTQNDDTYDTGCTQTTSRTFAMGHDAKLVGFLVRAELAGEEISLTNGGIRISFLGAVHAASKISQRLADKAQAQLDAARARLAKKELSKANAKAATSRAKAATPEAAPEPAPTHELRNIKVGRWVYTARVDLATGEATYSNAKGATVTVAKGKYTEQ